jgi:dipeptidyl aminopeptidase/acylaminoacyl peptidase
VATGKKRKTRSITAEDLYGFRLITDSRISPDGKWVVYSVERVDRRTEKRYSNLWIVSTGGGRPLRFTYGDQADSQPRWSPDGKVIAFISNRANAKQHQIYIIPFDGGEARQLTKLRGEFDTFEWSPDGKRLALNFRKANRQAIEQEKDKKKKELGIVGRHIDRVFFKYDGSGFLPKERWHIWTVDTRTGRARQLTKGNSYDELSPSWSPDGCSILFVSNRSRDPDLEPDNIDLFTVPAQGGRLRRIATPYGEKYAAGFSPDGRLIAYYGRQGKGEWWRNVSLWVVPAGGKGKARNLTGCFDADVLGCTINDLTVEPPVAPPVWSEDGTTIYFPVGRHGRGILQSVAVGSKARELEHIIDEKGVVLQFSMDTAVSRVAYLFGDMDHPVDLYVRHIGTDKTRRLTEINRHILQGKELGTIDEVWMKGPNGNDLHGWILKPPGFNPKKKYPSILEIHGGPQIQYGNLFMHEFCYLAANGYVVFFSNPRGGQGYGESHCKAIWGRWGVADYADLMAWTDYVARKPYVDRNRMGVTGGSYGGFMTNWIIGHTRRFKAAVTQRSITNMISKYGSGDYNWVLQYRFRNKAPWEDVRNYWKQSPARYFGKVKTPTLVIHSEQDLRCPIEQGEQIFVALKRLGVDTEMVRFPDEPHGLSRTGRTDRRIDRLRSLLGWFDRYLK